MTKVVKIGDRVIGGGNPILIQSMTNTRTEDVKGTVEQIHRLEKAGCEIIRCTVPTMEAAKAIKEIKTYGETNLDDIAKCYTQLAINNFNNASNSCVLPFEGYDELAYISRKDNEDIFIYDLNRFESKGEESHYNSLSSGYDKCLYLIVRNTINKLAKEITKKRLQ